MVSLESHVNLVVWIIGLVLLVITIVSYRYAISGESKGGELKGAHFFFPIVALVTALWWSELPGIQDFLPGCMSKFRGIVGGMAVPKDAAATTTVTGLPTGSPADYVEWVDKTHLQPKTGAPVLPTGWRVAVTNDSTKPGTVVDKAIEVTYTDVWVFFDPDTTVVSGKSALPALKLTLTRP